MAGRGQENDLRERIIGLRNDILNLRKEREPTRQNWLQARQDLNFRETDALRVKKQLVTKGDGHLKSIDFGSNMRLTVMAAGASSTGSVVVWDVTNEKRVHWIPLKSPWMMCCKSDSYNGAFVGTGGLDNIFYVYKTDEATTDVILKEPQHELLGHDAVIYCASFLPNGRAITGSGDKKLKIWDINRGHAFRTLEGHTGDVMTCDSINTNILISGAGDFSARVWDIREDATNRPRGELTYTFDVESRDVNDVKVFPDGYCFGTALNNTMVNLYDTRSNCKMMSFKDPNTYHQYPADQLAFSSSGRLMFVKYGDYRVLAYDVASGEVEANDAEDDENFGATKIVINQSLCHVDPGNREQASCIATDKEGRCLAMGIEKTGDDAIAKIFWPQRRTG